MDRNPMSIRSGMSDIVVINNHPARDASSFIVQVPGIGSQHFEWLRPCVRRELAKFCEIPVSQAKLERRPILFHVLRQSRSGDGNDLVLATRQEQPGQSL
jgi:hypothetical protein